MARKNSHRKTQVAQKHKPSLPENDLGHEAAIHPDITEVYPERDRLLLLDLPSTAIAELATMVSRSLIQDQRQQWVTAKLNGSETDILFYSQEDRMTAYFEILQDKILKLYGNVIYHEVDPETGEPLTELPVPPLYQITIEEAQTNGYPIPNPIPDGVNSRSPYLVVHLRLPQRGQTGEKGEQGEQGIQGQRGLQGIQGIQGIQGVAGAKGDKGDTGECECQPHPISDPNGNPISDPPGGSTGGGYGSGPGGTPNPDGKDLAVKFPCVSLGLTHGPHGTGVEYLNVDITGSIKGAAQASGKFNPATEELLSVSLHQEAVCYTGALGSITVPFFNIPLTQLARKATINQANSNTRLTLGSSDTTKSGTITVQPPSGYSDLGPVSSEVTAGGRVYNNDFQLNMQGSNAIVYDGQFPALPGWLDWVFSALLKTGPKTAAYHYMELCGLTKRKKLQTCPENAANPNAIQVPFVFNTPGDAPPSGAQWSYNSGWNTEGPYMFSTNRIERFNVYGFEVGKTYGMRIQTQVINGSDFSWAIVLPNFGYTQYGATAVHVNGTGQNAPVTVTLNPITITELPGLGFCDLFDVAIYGYLSIKHLEIYEI